MWPNQGPPGYNPSYPAAPPGGYPQAPNPGYPAGQYPAPMNPAMGPYAPPGGMPYGAPGATAYPGGYPVVSPGVVYPGPYPPNGDPQKGHHHGVALPLLGGLAGGLAAGVLIGEHKAHKHEHHQYGPNY